MVYKQECYSNTRNKEGNIYYLSLCVCLRDREGGRESTVKNLDMQGERTDGSARLRACRFDTLGRLLLRQSDKRLELHEPYTRDERETTARFRQN
jgi:hypothetical protein